MTKDADDSSIRLDLALRRSNRVRWDIFCAVVDNFGDLGVCWRLAQQLEHEYRVSVRMWVDNLERFAVLLPSISTEAAIQSVGQIEVRHWTRDAFEAEVADVVIEAFACQLPPAYIAKMVQRDRMPVWINLEYLTAEAWVEDCHLLTSPQLGISLKKHFFFPGFTGKTGGLIRERGLLEKRAEFNPETATRFWNPLGIPSILHDDGNEQTRGETQGGDELRVSLFCYDNPALPELLGCWAEGPISIRAFVFPGPAIEQTEAWLGERLEPGTSVRNGFLTITALPFLSQDQYDRLLWGCDVNFVRGEDSFVRAQWAQRPFVWQIYPQSENAHLVKLDAFLARYASGFQGSEILHRCFFAWNGEGEMAVAWRAFVAKRQQIEQHAKVWVSELDQAGNLADNLARFVCGE